MGSIILLIVLLTIPAICLSQECESLITCAECVTRNSSCAWCDDEFVFQVYASDINAQLEPAKLCGTVEDLSAVSCTNIYNPTGSVKTGNRLTSDSNDDDDDNGSGDVFNVSPELVTVNLRPGVRESVEVTVAPPESISVDMYVLMDLSFTMNDDLNGLRSFSNELVELMQSLTDEFRIAFGSFVDKPVDPFIGRENRDTPCNLEGPSIASQCVPTYAFRHHLDFTADATLFTYELGNASISGSDDDPEAMFDALLQVAVCEDQIGWRPIGTTRRIVLAMTDGDYHTALDGRLAGILRKPTTECRLNPETKFYDDAVTVDYPSSHFLADVMNEFRITPIFAARRRVRPLYEDLGTIIRSAFVGEISDSSTNLLNLISDQYQTLSTTVIPLINGANSINELTVGATPLNKCGAGNVSSTRPDTCENVVFPNHVMYELSLEVTPSFCERIDSGSIHMVQVLFIGFGAVSINISVQCSCPCEMDRIEESSNCSGRGAYECSTCICDENYVGTTCSCATGLSSVFGCTNREAGTGSDTICSGRGDCLCNECRCHSVPGLEGRTYQGRYCECDPFACPFGANENGQVLPCSGHGTCGCDSQCACDDGYSGSSCDCPSRVSTCKRQGDEEECSGAGQCRCGVCVCDDYSERRGQYCEECVSCRGSCSTLSDCVECLIPGDCGDSSCDNITITHSLMDIPNHNNTNFVFRNCSVANSNCEVVYQVDQNIVGIEEMIYVYIRNNQRSFVTWTESPSDCEPDPNILIYIIPVVIVVVIIIIVIVAVAGWKGITVLAEYSEYKAWERSQQREKWNKSEDNPLFVDPTAKYTNPKYRRPVQSVVIDE